MTSSSTGSSAKRVFPAPADAAPCVRGTWGLVAPVGTRSTRYSSQQPSGLAASVGRSACVPNECHHKRIPRGHLTETAHGTRYSSRHPGHRVPASRMSSLASGCRGPLASAGRGTQAPASAGRGTQAPAGYSRRAAPKRSAARATPDRRAALASAAVSVRPSPRKRSPKVSDFWPDSTPAPR